MKIDSIFNNKILLVTGGTGSFGNAIIKKFINSEIKEIRIFSRDEKKQDDMRKAFNSSKLRFYLGDVRDKQSLKPAINGVDFIFHAAALKQVPSCEFFPMEALKTNVLGTENVIDLSINFQISKIICLSTDKAVYPINAMGISKAMMEKVAMSKSRDSGCTSICVTRYGNVMGSRGSVIPLFQSQILTNEITITDPSMTRFMMSMNDAIELVLYAFEHGNSGDLFVQKAPACTIEILAKTLIGRSLKDNVKIKIIGTRHGEKKHETLLSREEMAVAVDHGRYFKVQNDFRDLNYGKFFEAGSKLTQDALDYNSSNTEQLDQDQLNVLLKKNEVLDQ